MIGWTVNTPGDLALVRALGLDGAITDYRRSSARHRLYRGGDAARSRGGL